MTYESDSHLIQWELEAIASYNFENRSDEMNTIAHQLKAAIGNRPTITLVRSYPVSDAFLERASLPQSTNLEDELNALLYKRKEVDLNTVREMTKEKFQEPFVIVDEFSFSGTKMITVVTRLLRMGFTDFRFISIATPDDFDIEVKLSSVSQLMSEQDKNYLKENKDLVRSRIQVITQDSDMLRPIAKFSNTVAGFKAHHDGIKTNGVYDNPQVIEAVDGKLAEIKGKDTHSRMTIRERNNS